MSEGSNGNLALNQFEKNLISQKLNVIGQHKSEIAKLERIIQEHLGVAITRAGMNPIDYVLNTRTLELVRKDSVKEIKDANAPM